MGMKRGISYPRLLAVFLAAGLTAGAAGAKEAAAPHPVPQVQFTEYRLPNGLRVILAPDRSAPVIAVSVVYDVGSRNERPGRTGFAHLFEHLMFQGSANVGRGEHFQLINDNGGSFNGTTNADRTNYFETLPANQLDMALFLEADRMRSLDISPFNLENQRQVVQEEKRQRGGSAAAEAVQNATREFLYSNFAYQHTTIGSMEDLNAATLDDVREFYKTYYAPNNAALAVVGDFNVSEAKSKVRKYFGEISSHASPPALDVSEPKLTEEKRKSITGGFGRTARYSAYYRTVPGNHPDYYALSVLAAVLSQGRTSRFNKGFVEKELATNLFASEGESRATGMFNITGSPSASSSVEKLEAGIDAELEKIKNEGVTDAELARARIQFRTAAARSRGALATANTLAQYAVFYNDPNRINTELTQLEAVTSADIQRVARQYLQHDRRMVLIVQPGRGGQEDDAPFQQSEDLR